MEIHEWDERASGYDKHIRRLFPNYETLHRLALVPAQTLPDGAKILVVGAGTGEEIARLLDLNPTFKITGQDLSEGMLAEAKQKLKGREVEWFCGPLGDLDATDFDAAYLVLVLHFMEDSEEEDGKSAFLKTLARKLRRGGLLVYADLMPDPESYETHVQLWHQFVLGQGTDERIIGALDYVTHDLPTTSPERNEKLLESAGFEEPVTFYQEFWLRLMMTRRR